MAGRGVLVIADVVLDLDRGRLRRSGGAGIPLRPKSLQLLEVLASNPGRLMTKAQLLDSVWPSIHVTEDSLFQCIRDVRRALGDFDGRMLRTVAKKGYLLDVPVEAHPSDPPANSQAWQRMDSPSLAVLPFSEDGGADGEGYFAEGFTSDLLAGLCRIRWLPVVARGSSFLFKDGRSDLRQVARRLGVRYVMQGSIQRAEGRLRVYAQIWEAMRERYVWADRFEGRLTDIFDLQDQIAASIVGAVEPTIRVAEVERARAKPTDSLDAYDLYLRALPLHLSSDRQRLSDAQDLLARAAVLDPGYSLAKAFSALTTVIQVNQGWATEPERQAGARLAREALCDDRNDPVVLRCAGHALAYLAREYETGVAVLDRALALHPNSAEVHHSAGWVWNFCCNGGKALPHFMRAMCLSPLDPEMGHTLAGLTFAHALEGRHEEALETSRKAMAATPNSISPLRAAILALCELGRADEAREVGRTLMGINPAFRVAAFARVQPFRDPAFTGRYLQALRTAGLPE